MFLRVISNAISSRVWPGREGGRARMFRGRRRVVGLPAIMRSSVFRCRSASPYRYVSSPCRSSLSLSPLSSRDTPATPDHPFGPARRSNGFTDSRYPQYSIFISESNFTAAVAIPTKFYDSLSLSFFLGRGHWWNLSLSENSRRGDSILIFVTLLWSTL